MTVRGSLTRTVLFASMYVLATLAGRTTVMDGTNLSIVWPAAGVLVLWFCAQRDAPVRWADLAALVLVSLVVNLATGAGGRHTVVFTLANVGQVSLFMWLFRCRELTRLRDLWILLGAAAAGSGLGAAIAATGLWLISGQPAWSAGVGWLSRNTASVLVVGAAGLRLGHAWHRRPPGWTWRSPLPSAGRWRVAEYAALIAASVAAYWFAFALADGLPVGFTLIAVTVWAGLRMPTAFVACHGLVVGAVAVVFTLHGSGAFAGIPDHAVRVLVAQLFVGMVAVIGLALALGRDERRTLLRQLTAEKADLAAQKEQAQQHGQLLTAIIDSMADGLTVIDAEGRVLLRNAATVRLLGDRLTAPGYYGLFHLDGRPMADHETAYARVIAGEEHAHHDLLVRDADRPEGRILTATGTRLVDEHGVPRAVVVVHDVTAERRQRDELAAFAGVVAHDLQNPLSSMRGWTDAAAEALREAPAHPMVADAESSLVRAQRAGVRMRALIDDLLAYATARDAAIRPVTVDLERIVTDIASARVDAAIAAAAPMPRFDIGALHRVCADAALVRQLLDNVIGNAIKYTAPGVTPAIGISSGEDEDGRIVVTITDNGIGIPDGQHEAIFGNFHRAHTGGSVAGTGLGLGICQRIVQRHGGVITAADNPGGGSRFSFTLPAAVTAHAASELVNH